MRPAMLLALALVPGLALADDPFELSVDLRLVGVDAPDSYLYGGLGKLRFDEDHDGVQVGRLRAAWSQPIGETFAAHVDASLWRFGDDNAFDLTEAWLEWRPFPQNGWRSRLKLGAFYAPISLEHRESGWTNPYLISSSAINPWGGEELRTIGAEYSLAWLGTRMGHAFDAELVAGAYGYNDPAGILIASRGWALHDRQTTLFGEVGEAGNGPVPGRVLFKEIDDRIGYYAGAELRYLDRAVLRVLHYDNRSDPEIYDPGIDDYAWLTVFDSVGLRVEAADGWTLIGQWLGGETSAEPETGYETWDFDSTFVLISKSAGPHRFSLRRDWFDSAHVVTSWPPGETESGDAWTVGYTFDYGDHWRFAVEALRIESDYTARAYIGEPPRATEDQLQLQVRYSL
jgi:hypothetical protein